MSWNPVLNLVKQVKMDYIASGTTRHKEDTSFDFKEILKELDNEEYNEIFKQAFIRQEENFVLFRYVNPRCCKEPNSIYREMRSVVIDIEKDCIVSAPFKKFFNLNELGVEENTIESVLEDIKKADSIEIVDKLDGSMQCANWYDGKLFFHGSSIMNPNNCEMLKQGYEYLMDSPNIIMMVKRNPDFTFIFECITDRTRHHVVKYDKRQYGLYLTGIRDKRNGNELSHAFLELTAFYYNVVVARQEDKTLENILKEAEVIKGDKKEGWVINILDTPLSVVKRVKLKGVDYTNISFLLNQIDTVNRVIKTIADGQEDDLLSHISVLKKEVQTQLIALVDTILDWVEEKEKELDLYYNTAPKNNVKVFAMWTKDNVPSFYRSKLMCKYKGMPYSILQAESGKYLKYKDDKSLEERIERLADKWWS